MSLGLSELRQWVLQSEIRNLVPLNSALALVAGKLYKNKN